MKIGIDISQIVHEGTGVGKYVREMVRAMIQENPNHEYVLFGASLRKRQVFDTFYASIPNKKSVTLSVFPIPPTLLDWLWNTLHIFPVEWFIGEVDVFWSSDWTQPPLVSAKGITTIHDLTIMRFPESFHQKILDVQKRRLKWAKKECDIFLCDSAATKKDCIDMLGISENKLEIVYPGFSLTL